MLKVGLFCLEDKSGDRELLEVYVSSGDTWVYSRIPEEIKDDLELAQIYLKNGGEWYSIPKALHSNQLIFECYLAHLDFDTDKSSSLYKLKRALEDHLGINDWDSSAVMVNFVDACLQKNLLFLSMLGYRHLQPDEWLTIAKNHDVSEHVSRPLKLRLALELKNSLDTMTCFAK